MSSCPSQWAGSIGGKISNVPNGTLEIRKTYTGEGEINPAKSAGEYNKVVRCVSKGGGKIWRRPSRASWRDTTSSTADGIPSIPEGQDAGIGRVVQLWELRGVMLIEHGQGRHVRAI